MKRKYIIFFMQFFTSLCIVSVGFASWTFVTPEITAVGNIQAENVLTCENVIYLDDSKDTDSISDGIQVFDYFSGGILDSDGNITDEAKITLYFIIDLDKYLEFYFTETDYDSQKIYNSNIKLTLSYLYNGDFNIFEHPIKENIKIDNYYISDIVNTHYDNYYYLEFNINNILANYPLETNEENIIEFEIDYIFSIDRLYFINNIYDVFKDGYQFIVDIKMEAYVNEE